MSKVITFSTEFQSNHPKAGKPTHFVEKILNQLQDFSLATDELAESQGFLLGKKLYMEHIIKTGFKKSHTIRAGKRFKVGDKFSPRIWSEKPYKSKQIIIACDVEIKKIYEFEMVPSLWFDECQYFINGKRYGGDELVEVAKNDGLSIIDFACWFAGKMVASTHRKPFAGQIICWNENINY